MPAPTPIPLADLARSARVSRFEGRDHGASVSFFATRNPPGTGAVLHRHPYDETFVVQEGEATFSVDGERVVCPAGSVLVVPGGAVHGFVSTGGEALRLISIHPSDHVVQDVVGELPVVERAAS